MNETHYDKWDEIHSTKKPKGGFRKIAEFPMPCLHPEHKPPMHIVLQPGLYEYECPGCGMVTTIRVPVVY